MGEILNVLNEGDSIEQVTIVCFDDKTKEYYLDALAELQA